VDLATNWDRIRDVHEASIRSSRHAAIATVDAEGSPHITPIGFLFLRDDGTAFFFDEYTVNLSRNIEANPKVCVLLVNSAALFWGAFLAKGRFATPPGVRLMGVAAQRRRATDDEAAALAVRLKPLRKTKGAAMIWSKLEFVRDIRFDSFEPVVYPKVTDDLWVG